MRRWNNILVRFIIGIFLLHALMGSLLLTNYSTISFSFLSWLLLILVVIHGILGILSTLLSIQSGTYSKRWYLKQNAGFWIKRISGIAIAILLIFHITAYSSSVDGIYFLKEFTFGRMVSQILLILAIFIHLAVSIRSMLIARGMIRFKEKTIDWMLVLSIMTLFFTGSVIIYYIQWQI